MRRYVITAAAALAAAGLTVGLTLATRTTTPHRVTQKGVPPLVLDLGVRVDPEAVALRRAADLYDAGKVAQAAGDLRALSTRWRRVSAQLLADWPRSFGGLRTAGAAISRGARSSSSSTGSRCSGAATAARRRTRMAGGAPRAAGHVVRAPRRGSAPPELPAGAAPVRAELPFAAGAWPSSRRRSSSPTCARTRPTTTATCSTASPSSGSGGSSPRSTRVPAGRRGRGPGRSRRRAVRQGESRRRRSPASARSRSAIRRTRACASTSGFACSGSGASTRRNRSFGWRARPGRRRRSGIEAQRFLRTASVKWGPV